MTDIPEWLGDMYLSDIPNDMTETYKKAMAGDEKAISLMFAIDIKKGVTQRIKREMVDRRNQHSAGKKRGKQWQTIAIESLIEYVGFEGKSAMQVCQSLNRLDRSDRDNLDIDASIVIEFTGDMVILSKGDKQYPVDFNRVKNILSHI
jgi:hypothetical protein